MSFQDVFGKPATVTARAPGRVNLMGEHTDYNEGFVLPMVVAQQTQVLLAAREDDLVEVFSANLPSEQPLRYRIGEERKRHGWIDYVQGCSAAARIDRGFSAWITSDVPLGGGLSSSASLTVALLRGLRDLQALQLDDLRLAKLAQAAEVDFVGAPVGIMDQMAASLGQPGAALFIDTRSLHYESVPLPASVELLIVDSGVRHNHATGAYRTRRDECSKAAELLKVPYLRDATDAGLLADPFAKRARHVISENARVLLTVDALRSGAIAAAGALFNASHASLRDDFEVSTPQVDALVESLQVRPDVLGARMTGGGFGGFVVALKKRI